MQSLQLEKLKKRLLKVLAFKQNGVYPPRGSDYENLCKRLSVLTLQERHLMLSLAFGFKIFGGIIYYPESLSYFPFRVPRTNNWKSGVLLYLPPRRNNIMVNSPISRVCMNINFVYRRANGELYIFDAPLSSFVTFKYNPLIGLDCWDVAIKEIQMLTRTSKHANLKGITNVLFHVQFGVCKSIYKNIVATVYKNRFIQFER